jgi:hypothetical protein
MKQLVFILLLIVLLPSAACTGPISGKAITGKIVNAETGQPIEGAILLVEWTKDHGFGNTYTTSEKVVEILSDKNGIVEIPGYDVRFVNNPDITVYKPGYVAWNNHWIFPDTRKRTDFEWKNGYVFRLDEFKEGYSYRKHRSFILHCIKQGLSGKDKMQFITMYENAESDKCRKELIHE